MQPAPSVLAIILGVLVLLFGLYLIGAGLYGVVKARLAVWPFGEMEGRGRFGWMAGAGLVLLLAPAVTTRASFGAALVGLVAYLVVWLSIYGLIIGKLGRLTTRKQIAGLLAAGVVIGVISSSIESSSSAVVAYNKAQEEAKVAAKGVQEEARKAAETESQYKAALQSAESGDCIKAGPMFGRLGEYKDAKSRHFDCEYRLAKDEVAAKRWIEAATFLEVVPDDFKPDVKGLKTTVHQAAVATYWDLAGKAKEAKQYEAALTHLNQLKALGEKDSEAEIAAVAKLKSEVEAKARAEAARITTEAGEKPTNSAWDGGVFEVEKFLKGSLKDPKSFEAIEWYKPTLGSLEGQYAWRVRVRYRAKNSFGGFVVADQLFYIRHAQVVHYE